jgi:hypothetical protein
MKWLVNVSRTMSPIATIPFAGLVGRWQLPDRVLEQPPVFTRESWTRPRFSPYKGRLSAAIPRGLNRQLRENLEVNDFERRGTTATSVQEGATKKTTACM